ncbi:DUF1627 domain-containing protein [Escherichia coli O128:H42]|uniref:DUF1627 domain-containing protein n=2 Tax=Escherichia coli TaxID=562 RepID=UPI000B7F9DB0|nr:DUF1627 domain-containing protein [Escherichia coli]EFA4190291.1 DUF1627 domain-containing protein [Escherichia coli O128:H42]EFA4219331.1 DUF1627 domain-containing protein [Escherichia coli O19:H42]EEZ6064708.1 DUF1627 domain-containing protein [Escherichia coli]EFB1548273.1 DUF1627 domain-containing protein [Escherichia coli]EFB6644237.1 DUF1627 domain-containing protein [Escherichia coli]
METVFDALKAMGKASSQEVTARLGMTRDEAINELWKLKRRGWADNKGSMWWLTNEKSDENDTVTQAPKVTAQMLIEAIERHGPKAADELALMFRITSRRVNSSLAMAISKGCLIRVNQNGKFRYCMPGGNLPAQEAATQEDIKTETVADIVQSLPSFTETRANGLILPSLHMANRELRRAKSHVQKWERVCAALRELNKHRDMVAGICRKSGQ